jgi:hypothetical protein
MRLMTGHCWAPGMEIDEALFYVGRLPELEAAQMERQQLVMKMLFGGLEG